MAFGTSKPHQHDCLECMAQGPMIIKGRHETIGICGSKPQQVSALVHPAGHTTAKVPPACACVIMLGMMRLACSLIDALKRRYSIRTATMCQEYV
mgnify:CR=1 FL=1